MALSSLVVLEIRQGGSDTNGGGFHTGATGTDWSQQNTPQYSVTDGVTAGTTTITSATANFGADVVGNLVYVQGGTGAVAANWYEIITWNSATSITVDRSTGLTAGTGVTLHIGGALKTPGVLTSVAGGIGAQTVDGQKAWVKYSATPYGATTATAGPGGPCSIPTSRVFTIEGYDVTRGDRTGNRPVYQWQIAPAAATYLFTLPGNARQAILNVTADANSQANGLCFSMSSRCNLTNCIAINSSATGGIGFGPAGNGGNAVQCQSSNCITGFTGPIVLEACDATGCTTGYTSYTGANRCLARGCTNGFLTPSTNGITSRCTADNCSTAGFSSTNQSVFSSCLASNCTGTGFVLGNLLSMLINCASYNNVTIASGTPVLNEGPFASGNSLTSLGADPYVNQAGADFRPNNNNPGGAQLRNAGSGVYGQTDNSDIGAVQHADPAGGGNLINQGEY